jgi:hypothetical protein
MFISKSCSYGIRSVVYLSGQPDDKYVSIRDISNDLNISYHFLTKILQIFCTHRAEPEAVYYLPGRLLRLRFTTWS